MIFLDEKEENDKVAKDSSKAGGLDITKVRNHIRIILGVIEMDMELGISKIHGKIYLKDKNKDKIKVNNLNPLIILCPIAI